MTSLFGWVWRALSTQQALQASRARREDASEGIVYEKGFTLAVVGERHVACWSLKAVVAGFQV